MKTVLPCAVTLVVVLLGAHGYPVSLTLYDNFNARHIDPDKWFGTELAPQAQAGKGIGAGTEAIRQIQDGRLRLLYRAYGRTDSNSGRLRRELALIFQNSAAVTAIQATVQVTAVATTGCPGNPGNPEHTMTWARLGGRFFAAPTSRGPVTDVVAIIYLGRRSDAAEPPNVLRVRAGVFHCADTPCTDASELFSQDLGAVRRGQMARLRVQWDQGTHRFIFQRDKAKEIGAPYTVSDTDPPGIPAKLLSATLFVPNCTATTLRPRAFIGAWFDDVMVNESAAPRAER
jgi:hypothetical protein